MALVPGRANLMLICREPGLLFIKTMKTAGSSIEIALGPALRDGDLATPLWPQEERQRPGKTVRRAVRRMVRALRERSDGAVRARYPHHGYDVAAKYLSAEIEGCRAFCVERNPYDKAVSAFHFVYDRYNRPVTDPGQHSRNSASPRGWLRSPISTCTRVMANW